MFFREDDIEYKKLRKEWLEEVSKVSGSGRGFVAGRLHDFMLLSYRLMRHIRVHLNEPASMKVINPNLPDIYTAISITNDTLNKKFGLVSLFLESDRLELLSRTIFKWLKEKNELMEK